MQKKMTEIRQTPEQKRQDSLGEALRNNLRRRKQQKRERSEKKDNVNLSEEEKK